ncbi:uncharcterized protein [Sporisorium scitamineum]|uniref:Uncharcterized protein n=1 Tax=Sporisorium scitamineum TaxID=49012 RepID=A0A127Z5B9_9BASI|nr:uncharcterized protein [Sporisorium scitamineum]
MFSKNFLITFLAAALALPWANALTLPEDTVLWRPGEPPNSFLATVNRLVAEAVQGMQPTDYTAHGTPVYPSAPNGAVEAIFRSLQQDRRFHVDLLEHAMSADMLHPQIDEPGHRLIAFLPQAPMRQSHM